MLIAIKEGLRQDDDTDIDDKRMAMTTLFSSNETFDTISIITVWHKQSKAAQDIFDAAWLQVSFHWLYCRTKVLYEREDCTLCLLLYNQ